MVKCELGFEPLGGGRDRGSIHDGRVCRQFNLGYASHVSVAV